MAKTKESIICTIADKEYLLMPEFEVWMGVSKDTVYLWETMGLKRVKIRGKLYYSKELFREFAKHFIE